MWRHGNVNVNGDIVGTSWKVIGGHVVAIDLPKATAPDVDIMIDGQRYAIEHLGRQELSDRVTVPLITRDEMDRRTAESEAERAKARAEFEGRPWPPVAVEAKTEVASGKPGEG